MGFHLRCAIAKVDDDSVADHFVEFATALYPSFVRVRRFDAPFAGVIAAYDPQAAHDLVHDNWEVLGYADENAAIDDIEEAIESRIAHLSHEFPDTPIAFVDVDCFGGTCMYRGYVVNDGLQTYAEPASANAHVRLFEHMGVKDPQWHFPPFTRGFMDSGVASDLSRLPATYYVHAHWDEPFRLAAMRASMLPKPWQVTIMTETSCVVVHGEQFHASLNAVDDHVRLDARSFVELTLTKTLAHELTNDDVALELEDADGKPL